MHRHPSNSHFAQGQLRMDNLHLPASRGGTGLFFESEQQSATANSSDPVPPSDIEINVRNVVCCYTVPMHIDLRRVALRIGNVLFDRGKGCIMKQKRCPSCHVKIYSSGKVYIVGCRSEEDTRRAARGVARTIQRTMGKLDQVVSMKNYRICNVMATCKFPFGIKIEQLHSKYPENSEYEPELSVGLIWRYQNPRTTLRIHTTGSIIITGARCSEDVQKAVELIYPIASEFQCSSRYRPQKESTLGRGRKRTIEAVHSRYKRPRVNTLAKSGIVDGKMYFSDEDDSFYDGDLN